MHVAFVRWNLALAGLAEEYAAEPGNRLLLDELVRYCRAAGQEEHVLDVLVRATPLEGLSLADYAQLRLLAQRAEVLVGAAPQQQYSVKGHWKAV